MKIELTINNSPDEKMQFMTVSDLLSIKAAFSHYIQGCIETFRILEESKMSLEKTYLEKIETIDRLIKARQEVEK